MFSVRKLALEVGAVAIMMLAGHATAQSQGQPSRPIGQPHSGRLRISEDQFRSRLFKAVQPIYPEEAKRRGIRGAVVLRVIVNARGDVVRVHVISGDELLAKSAADAVRKWICDPYPQDRPVEFETQVTLKFGVSAN